MNHNTRFAITQVSQILSQNNDYETQIALNKALEGTLYAIPPPHHRALIASYANDSRDYHEQNIPKQMRNGVLFMNNFGDYANYRNVRLPMFEEMTTIGHLHDLPPPARVLTTDFPPCVKAFSDSFKPMRQE